MSPLPNEEVDHINGDGLDNRRENIRLASPTQNQQNKRKQSAPASSRYKGVTFKTARGRWEASIRVDGKNTFLGRFHDEEAAAHAYDAAARIHHGRFASLNFPDDETWEGETYQPREPESGYKGVKLTGGKWQARLQVNGVTKSLGYRDTAEAAAHLYDTGVRHLRDGDGELNFPDDLTDDPAFGVPRAYKSGYIGVFPYKTRWRARMTIEGKQVHLGTFDTAEAAARAYDDAARAAYGDQVKLNFP
jgi:hypothetical protein